MKLRGLTAILISLAMGSPFALAGPSSSGGPKSNPSLGTSTPPSSFRPSGAPKKPSGPYQNGLIQGAQLLSDFLMNFSEKDAPVTNYAYHLSATELGQLIARQQLLAELGRRLTVIVSKPEYPVHEEVKAAISLIAKKIAFAVDIKNFKTPQDFSMVVQDLAVLIRKTISERALPDFPKPMPLFSFLTRRSNTENPAQAQKSFDAGVSAMLNPVKDCIETLKLTDKETPKEAFKRFVSVQFVVIEKNNTPFTYNKDAPKNEFNPAEQVRLALVTLRQMSKNLPQSNEAVINGFWKGIELAVQGYVANIRVTRDQAVEAFKVQENADEYSASVFNHERNFSSQPPVRRILPPPKSGKTLADLTDFPSSKFFEQLSTIGEPCGDALLQP